MTTFMIASLFLGAGILTGIFIGSKVREGEIEKKNDEIRKANYEIEFARSAAGENKEEIENLKSKLDNITRAKSNGCTPSDACIGCKHALYDVKLSSGQTGFICTKNPPCEGFERKEKVNIPPIILPFSYPPMSYRPDYSWVTPTMMGLTDCCCQNAIRM